MLLGVLLFVRGESWQIGLVLLQHLSSIPREPTLHLIMPVVVLYRTTFIDDIRLAWRLMHLIYAGHVLSRQKVLIYR